MYNNNNDLPNQKLGDIEPRFIFKLITQRGRGHAWNISLTPITDNISGYLWRENGEDGGCQRRTRTSKVQRGFFNFRFPSEISPCFQLVCSLL